MPWVQIEGRMPLHQRLQLCRECFALNLTFSTLVLFLKKSTGHFLLSQRACSGLISPGAAFCPVSKAKTNLGWKQSVNYRLAWKWVYAKKRQNTRNQLAVPKGCEAWMGTGMPRRTGTGFGTTDLFIPPKVTTLSFGEVVPLPLYLWWHFLLLSVMKNHECKTHQY